MSSLNIPLICRDAKRKAANVRILLYLCFLRDTSENIKDQKQILKNSLLQVWVREELGLFQRRGR